MALDPTSSQVKANHAILLSGVGRYDDALAELNQLIAVDPEFPNNYGNRAAVYWHFGNVDAYVPDLVSEMTKMGRLDFAEAFASGYKNGKLKGACVAIIAVLKKRSQSEYVSAYYMATWYALMGDSDHTFEWLEKAYVERSGNIQYIKIEPFFQPYRSDPRYIDLLRRMNLPH